MTEATPEAPKGDLTGAVIYSVLACGLTWGLAVPVIRAWSRGEVPPGYAVACAGLSAFGPTLAALAVAAPQRRLREVFGRWRTNVVWPLLALFAPMVIHLVATAITFATGGHPTTWLHLPQTAENVAALVVFPIGEEFGWRGLLQPRLARRFGVVRGSLLVGLVWGIWHLAYAWTPQAHGHFDPGAFWLTMIELPPYALLMAWVLQRGRESLWIAIAFHAGAHLDHLEREPLSNLHLHVVHLVIVYALAIAAGWSLGRPGRQAR